LTITLWSKYFNHKLDVKMKDKWISPKTIIGSTAIGTYYFPRPDIEALIWEEINKGNHALFAAPRRVGKTSVMLAMQENCPEDTRCEFADIEGVASETEFYKVIFELLFKCLSRFKKGNAWVEQFIKGLNIEEITLEGVKFGDKKSINYIKEIDKTLLKISEENLRVILLLDELPEVLNKLNKRGLREEASNILSRMRQWRQKPEYRNHFSMVLAGSVGLHHIVKIIEGRTADINDLGIIPFEPLDDETAMAYIDWATASATVKYDQALKQYFLSKIQYHIPYFLNLMLDEISKIARKANNPIIQKNDIDRAFETVVKNSDYFQEWKNRLSDYFTPDETSFLQEVLLFIAHKNSINTRQLYDLAKKHKKTDRYMELVGGLERDGYIFETQEQYAFVSPFLQSFWKKDNPIYDVK
jgi:uncharacterized protein